MELLKIDTHKVVDWCRNIKNIFVKYFENISQSAPEMTSLQKTFFPDDFT